MITPILSLRVVSCHTSSSPGRRVLLTCSTSTDRLARVEAHRAGQSARNCPPGRRGSGRRTSRCSGRSAACSAWARPSRCSAPRPRCPGRGRVLRRAGHEDPRRRDNCDHQGVHRQHPRRIQARHGRPPVRWRGGQGRRRRRDPGPRAAGHPRLPEPARPDRGLIDPDGGCTPATSAPSTPTGSVGDRPEEGADHHRGRGEYRPPPRWRTCWWPTR